MMNKYILECSFSVLRLDSANATGLFEYPQASLQQFGISVINVENCKRLINIGTDSPSANVAAAGLKGLLRRTYHEYSGYGV